MNKAKFVDRPQLAFYVFTPLKHWLPAKGRRRLGDSSHAPSLSVALVELGGAGLHRFREPYR